MYETIKAGIMQIGLARDYKKILRTWTLRPEALDSEEYINACEVATTLEERINIWPYITQ